MQEFYSPNSFPLFAFSPFLKPGAQAAGVAGEFGVAEAFNRGAVFNALDLDLAFPVGHLGRGLGADLLVGQRRGERQTVAGPGDGDLPAGRVFRLGVGRGPGAGGLDLKIGQVQVPDAAVRGR